MSEEPPGSAAAPAASTEPAIEAALRLIAQRDERRDGEGVRVATAELDRAVERARAESAGDPRLNYVLGRWHAWNGRSGDAITALRKYVDSRDGRNDWRAHAALGELFADQFPQLAKSSFDQASALTSDEPIVLFGLARCAEKLGRGSEAIGHARRLVEIAPEPRYRAYLARLYFAQRQWDDAEREARTALNTALERAQHRPDLSLDVDIEGFYRLLIDMARARLVENPQDAEQYMTLARLTMQRADHVRLIALREALAMLQLGMDTLKEGAPPRLEEAWATALGECGKHEEARAAWARILARDPTHAVAAEWLKKLEDGESDGAE